jgi:hypothetical protein
LIILNRIETNETIITGVSEHKDKEVSREGFGIPDCQSNARTS